MTWLSPDERSNLQYPFTAQGLALKQQRCIPVTAETQISRADHCPCSSSTMWAIPTPRASRGVCLQLLLLSYFPFIST